MQQLNRPAMSVHYSLQTRRLLRTAAAVSCREPRYDRPGRATRNTTPLIVGLCARQDVSHISDLDRD